MKKKIDIKIIYSVLIQNILLMLNTMNKN